MPDKQILFVLLLAVSLPASALTAADRCPMLPENSGFIWRYSQGPDFDVCYAEKQGVPATAKLPPQMIGVYIGYAPSFHPDPSQLKQDGRIGNSTVHWYRKPSEDASYRIGVETLYDIHPLTAHIWAQAQDERSLAQLLAVIAKMDFGKLH